MLQLLSQFDLKLFVSNLRLFQFEENFHTGVQSDYFMWGLIL